MTPPAPPKLLCCLSLWGSELPQYSLGFPSGLLRGSLSSCSRLCREKETTGERLQLPLLPIRPGPARGNKVLKRSSLPSPSSTCSTDPQASLHSVRGMGASSSACPISTAPPPQSWAGLDLKNSRAGRGSLPGRQTRFGATTRKAQRFHFSPKTPGLEGDVINQQGTLLLFPVMCPFSCWLATFPLRLFPLCFLKVGRHERGRETQQWRGGIAD